MVLLGDSWDFGFASIESRAFVTITVMITGMSNFNGSFVCTPHILYVEDILQIFRGRIGLITVVFQVAIHYPLQV